jgi:hypothetical protein
MTSRVKSIAVVLPALAVVVAATVAMTASGAPPNHAVKLHSSPSPAASVRLREVFNVLRVGSQGAHSAYASAEQPLPAAVVEGMRAQAGVDPSEAVYTGGIYPTWVVPGGTTICVVVGTTGPTSVPSSACGSISVAEQRGLAISTENSNGAPIVIGLAPNGNTSVEATNTDGTTETIPVANNVYEITTGRPDAVTLNDASGTPTTRYVALPVPPPPSAPAGSAAP